VPSIRWSDGAGRELDAARRSQVIRLQRFDYTCGGCGHPFSSPELVVGELLLLRSEGRGTLAVLPIVDNSVLDEVGRLVRELPSAQGRSDHQVGGATQEALSVVFDPDEDGSRFVVGGRPRCPRCGWSSPSEWRASDPPEFIESDVPRVGHRAWDGLEIAEKRRRIAQAVADAFSE
jgi:hypothetical protein